MKKWPMTSLTERINLVNEEPVATWVATEAAAKTPSADNFTQLTLTAYELAVIVPFTDRLRDNANIDLVQLIRDEAENAIVTALEQSYLGYYAGTPFAQTLSANTPVANTIAFGTGADLVVDISNALGAIEVNGFSENIGFVAHPSLKAALRNLRTTTGEPIYVRGGSSCAPECASLFGYPIRYTRNMQQTGSPAAYELICADWKYAIEGTRQELRMDIIDKATITIAQTPVNLWEKNMSAGKFWCYRAFAIRDVNALGKVTGL